MKTKHITYFIIIAISIGSITLLKCNAQTENTLTWKKKGSPPNGFVKEVTINDEYAGCYTWKNNTAMIHDPNKVSKENCNSTLLTTLSNSSSGH